MKTPTLSLLCFLILSLWGATDPFIGTWKLSTAKSNFPPDAPSFFLGSIQVESDGKGLKSTAAAADGEGIVSDFTFTCQLDGSPCHVTPATSPMRGESAVDSITLKRIDPNTIIATGTRNGKFVYSDRRIVSADGKTLTVVRNGTTPEGTKYKSTIILERIR